MASLKSSLVLAFFFAFLLQLNSAARLLAESGQTQLFRYHNGPLLTGNVSINLIWYGKFKPSQRAIVSDFIASLSSSKTATAQPSVATWMDMIEKYYRLAGLPGKHSRSTQSPLALSPAAQILDENYSLGKSLDDEQIKELASKAGLRRDSTSINVVLTSSDVVVRGFCSSRCGTHDSSDNKLAYIWVGNSETQCPGQCAWPFHQPIYGPQGPPLVAPNNDVGLDGIVINLASLLAGTVTNPFKNGYYQGSREAPLEAATACPGVYAKGAYPGYAGDLLVDSATGASYNAHGINSRKFLLPALFDPTTQSCSTLV